MSLWYNKIFQPLSLMRTATLLREDGHNVEIIDANALKKQPRSQYWSELDAEAVIVTTSSLDKWQCPFLNLDAVKDILVQLNPNIFVILNGAHGTTSTEYVFTELNPNLIVRGEPEFTNREIIRKLSAKENYFSLAGISYKASGKIIDNPIPPPIDVDQLPLPAYDLIEMPRYNYELMGNRFIIMETSRGCPFRCKFCLLNMYRKKYSARNIESVLDEVEMLQKRYGIRNIFFYDLEFVLPKKRERAIDFCKAILKRKLKFKWAIQTRVDSVNNEVLFWMRKAGCVLIHYGVESGNPDILKTTQKGIRIDQIQRAFKETRKNGIRSLDYFLFGHPTEKREDILRTIQFAKELNPNYASFVIAMPYPGTEYYDKVDKKRQQFPLTASLHLSPKELESLRKRAIREYYLRPSYFVSQLSRFRSWEEIKILFKGVQKVFLPLITNSSSKTENKVPVKN